MSQTEPMSVHDIEESLIMLSANLEHRYLTNKAEHRLNKQDMHVLRLIHSQIRSALTMFDKLKDRL